MKKIILYVALMSATIGFSQELLLNGSADEFTFETGDNADAWDMTPNSTVVDNTGATIDSPYRPIWRNTDLNDYIDTTFCTNEQPATTGDGNKFPDQEGSRGLKISETCRRLYQFVAVTAGTDYIFSIDSRSEAAGTPTEVFILNTEIANEVGLSSTAATVDAYLEITNDENSSKSSTTSDTFSTNTLQFTASSDIVVVYVRSSNSIDSDTEVFYDNLSLMADTPLSNNDFTINGTTISAFPVPMNETLNIGGIDVDNTTLYSMNGAVVAKGAQSVNVATLSSGVYILEVESNGKSTSTIVVK